MNNNVTSNAIALRFGDHRFQRPRRHRLRVTTHLGRVCCASAHSNRLIKSGFAQTDADGKILSRESLPVLAEFTWEMSGIDCEWGMAKIELRPILDAVLRGYSLPLWGIHGLSHWVRVLENGLKLAEVTGADRTVVSLFALFHDSKRVNEHIDPKHGRRGADFARTLRGSLFELDDHRFNLLYVACDRHTDGHTRADVTIQTCWDSDRLDLGRVGTTPAPQYLCTDAAKSDQMIEWAHPRATSEHIPDMVSELWDGPIPA